MKLCSTDPTACWPVCDFCKHFSEHQEEVYVGNPDIDGDGRCMLHDKYVWFSDECGDFECFRIEGDR